MSIKTTKKLLILCVMILTSILVEIILFKEPFSYKIILKNILWLFPIVLLLKFKDENN
jgi:hypothetical protein